MRQGSRLRTSKQRSRADQLDAGAIQVAPCASERAVEIDRAAGIVDHADFETASTRVERSPRDAEVGREAANVELPKPLLLEEAGEPGGGFAVGFEEARVAVDVAAEVFSYQQLRALGRSLGVKSGARASLDAVVEPKDLRAVRELDRLEGFLSGMGRGERSMAARVPVLRQHDVLEARGEAVDQRHDLVAPGHGERAPRTE